MKIKKNGVIIDLTEGDIKKINKSLIKEGLGWIENKIQKLGHELSDEEIQKIKNFNDSMDIRISAAHKKLLDLYSKNKHIRDWINIMMDLEEISEIDYYESGEYKSPSPFREVMSDVAEEWINTMQEEYAELLWSSEGY